MKLYSYFMALLIAVTMTGCAQKESATGEHAHDENLQITGYSNDFEVYAEATPFVAGEAGDVLAHFT